MKVWKGSAGVCVNENGQLLMVLQGKPDEIKSWAVPSGGLEKGETFEECCIREIHEETGYITEVIEEVKVKIDIIEDIDIEVHYFKVRVIGGEKRIQDPDDLIYDIEWKNLSEMEELRLSFPEDREFLIDCVKDSYSHSNH